MNKTSTLTEGQLVFWVLTLAVALASGGYLPIGLEQAISWLANRSAENSDPFFPLAITAVLGITSLSLALWRKYWFWHYPLVFNFGFFAYLGLGVIMPDEPKVIFTLMLYAYGVAMIVPMAVIIGRTYGNMVATSKKPADPNRVGKVILQ